MSQNLKNFAKFQEFQLDNLVDFEKCCKTHIFLQKSEPIQPKTSNILPKFCLVEVPAEGRPEAGLRPTVLKQGLECARPDNAHGRRSRDLGR